MKAALLAVFFVFLSVAFVLPLPARAQTVNRVVVVKIDGLPGDFVDRFVNERDSKTGKSVLPWFEEIFYKNGVRLSNFYTRGMSLSAPAWSIVDTGQHLQIKGNVEYDRYTLHAYDYLNFIPYYINYGLKRRADMPGVEVLDKLHVPLIADAFPFRQRYTSYQLYQRGIHWEIFGGAFKNLIPRDAQEFKDEWSIGYEFRKASVNQHERDIIGKLTSEPNIDYFDYYSPDFDHISHHNNDTKSRISVLKELDRTIGRIWTAIQNSPRGAETALFVVSDHGVNADNNIYSQGFNIVKLLASREGGGHHLITKRRLLLDYSLKGVYPLVPLITTTSNESYYLKGQSTDYPTVLVDFDGNERSSLHFRNSDLNVLQILLQQLQNEKLSPELKRAATDSLFDILNNRRAEWQRIFTEINEELAALRRWIDARRQFIKEQGKTQIPEENARGTEELVRINAEVENTVRAESQYRKYLGVLGNLLALKRENFDARKIKIDDLIAKGAMGERNSIFQLQNYVVGLSPQGLTLDQNGRLDFEKSFRREDYFDLFQRQSVRNNVQPGVSHQPIDFIGTNIPLESIADALPPGERQPNENPIWLYAGRDRQALILAHRDASGKHSFRYLPIADLRQREDGKFSFQIKQWTAGLPLKIFEDEKLDVFQADKIGWLSEWHQEPEWFRATHKTQYSNAVIGLNEQLDDHPPIGFEIDGQGEDRRLIYRFRMRQRAMSVPDLLLLANNHWNFDVRGFNPGGNHGSFFRVSSNSTLMMAGGDRTGIPRGVTVEEPYDSLSFAPTLFRLMGKIDERGEPLPELRARGFRRFPGRVINEIFQP